MRRGELFKLEAMIDRARSLARAMTTLHDDDVPRRAILLRVLRIAHHIVLQDFDTRERVDTQRTTPHPDS